MSSQGLMSPISDSMRVARTLEPLRFGVALAKLRSRHADRLRKEALSVIKENVRKHRSVRRQTRKDALWSKHAQLQEVFDFLA